MELSLMSALLVIFIVFITMDLPLKSSNNYKKLTKIASPLMILGFLFLLTKIIITPINFENDRNYRYEFVQEKLINIRSAQLAYRENNGQFTDDFDELIRFVKVDSFVLVQKKDTLETYINEMLLSDNKTIYREEAVRYITLIDTLEKVSVLDSLFNKEYPIDSLAHIPFHAEEKFILQAGVINKSKIDEPVFEAKAKKEHFLNGLDKTLIKSSAKDLIIGSMTAANLNGNWQ